MGRAMGHHLAQATICAGAISLFGVETDASGKTALKYCRIVGSSQFSLQQSLTSNDLMDSESRAQGKELSAWFEMYLISRAAQGEIGVRFVDEDNMILLSLDKWLPEFVSGVQTELLSVTELYSDYSDISDLDSIVATGRAHGGVN